MLTLLTLLTATTAAAAKPPMAADETPTVTIQNNEVRPVEVYLELGDEELPLGEVDGGTVKTLTLPDWLRYGHREVQFDIHPKRGGDLASGYIEVEGGHHYGIKVTGP
ncbi:MAG: hypothetical protein R2882_00990 [Gemmatimonadales bacterium]